MLRLNTAQYHCEITYTDTHNLSAHHQTEKSTLRCGEREGECIEFTGYACHLVGLHDMLCKDVFFHSFLVQSEHGVNT
jgi:hypothetical protein